MAKITVYNSKGKETGKLTIDDSLTNDKVNSKVLYQVVNNYLASRHMGTHKTKNRAEVRGGGKKPWRQKGTGRARFGSIRNPIWRGGGVAFGPSVRSYSYSVPRKAKKTALLEAVKSKIQNNNIVVFDSISLEKPKTKDMSAVMTALGVDKGCLLVTEKAEHNLRLSARNLPGLSVKPRKEINALDVMRSEKLVVSEEALKNILGKAE